MKQHFLTILIICSVTLVYAQVSKTVNLATAGTLTTALTAKEKMTISNLTITGQIDARDFTTMEDEMTLLQVLDLSEANILAYSGVRKLGFSSFSDPKNALPTGAFMFKTLTSIIIPNATDSISPYAFQNFSGNINVDEKNNHFSSLDGILFNKTQTNLLVCPVSNSGVYSVPSSVTSIGRSAFYGCKNLTQVLLPKSLTYIGATAFGECTGLKSFTIPESVSFIGEGALFMNDGDCKFDINVDENNPYFSSLDNIVFDKNKTRLMICSRLKTGSYSIPSTVTTIDPYAFKYCELLTSVSIPPSVTNIGKGAFELCRKLTGALTIPSSVSKIGDFTFFACNFTSIVIPNTITSVGTWAFMGNDHLVTVTIPSSVKFLGDGAFGCVGLKSVYANSSVPVYIESSIKNVFAHLDKSECILYVPYGTKSLYASANQWEKFANIIEDTRGFSVGVTSITLASTEGSNSSVNIKSNVSWVASSNQSWLQISPANGYGTMSLAVTAVSTNPLLTVRTAKVTVSADGELSEDIIITQEAAAKTINNTAGKLSTIFTSEELKTITVLVITGTIDARDFKVMRDDMPLLSSIDLTNASIVEYSGPGGTITYEPFWPYKANTIPEEAFYDRKNNVGKSTLKQVKLPLSNTTIGYMSFAGVNGLYSIVIPKSISKIDNYAFYKSTPNFIVDADNQTYTSLEGVLLSKDKTALLNYPRGKEGAYEIPNTVNSINEIAFYECGKLTGTLSIPNSVKTIGYCAFMTCRGLTGTLTLPSSVTSIGGYAFANCNGFTSLVIPSSVTSIGNSAFAACQGLTSIYVNSITPLDLSSVTSVFDYVDKNTCILYVPIGSKSAYQSAVQWKDFTNIKEYNTTSVELLTAGEIFIYPNPVTEGFRFSGIKEKSTYRILDIKGKLLKLGDICGDEFVSINSLPGGIYIVKIISSSRSYEFKILKN